MTQISSNPIVEAIPGRISDTQLLNLLHAKNEKEIQVQAFKDFLNIKDAIISDWLNISVKTFRNYKKSDTQLKENTKEQIILLISLFKHGRELFGSAELFLKWLNLENQYLDQEKPISFLNTVTGIRFINDRLTAMEFGDNV